MTILIKDKLKQYIVLKAWPREMRYIIGKIFDVVEKMESVGVSYYKIRQEDDPDSFWWIPIDCADVVEDENPGKIKWYYKGKLKENKLFESKEYIGKRVKMRDDSMWRWQAYEEYDNGFKIIPGNGYGTIIDYTALRDHEDGLPYRITWDNGHNNSYDRKDFDFVDEIELAGKVKWYNKGKLEEKITKIFEAEEDIGRKVKMRDDSPYREQAYDNGGDGYGKIIEWIDDEVEYGEEGHPYEIEWNNDVDNIYRRKDFDFVDEIELAGKVKWYNKGKLEEIFHNGINYEVGYKVKHKRHPEFGVGVIRQIDNDDEVIIDFENLNYRWDGSLGLGYYEIVEEEPVGKIKWYNKGILEEKEKWWKEEDKILILPKLEEVIWTKNWDKKYYNLIGRVFTVQGYSLGDYIIQDGDNFFRIPTDCAVPPDSDDLENKEGNVRWYHKGKLEKLTTKFEMFEKIKWYNKGKFEEDTNIPEETLHTESEYFYGEVSADNIEIVPCIIKFNVVKRAYDGIVLWEDEEDDIEEYLDDDQRFIAITMPHEAGKVDDKLRYVYRKDVDKKECLDVLTLLIRRFTTDEKAKARFTHILKVFADDIVSIAPYGKIINLI